MVGGQQNNITVTLGPGLALGWLGPVYTSQDSNSEHLIITILKDYRLSKELATLGLTDSFLCVCGSTMIYREMVNKGEPTKGGDFGARRRFERTVHTF